MPGVKTLHGVTAKNLRQRTVTDGACYNVHRLMHELRRGPVPEGRILLHRCDKPLGAISVTAEGGTLTVESIKVYEMSSA